MISFTFDVEPDLHTGAYKGVSEGLARAVKILNKYQVKATFFVTCDCIEKYPKIFQELKKQGHEIALHAYRHDRFDDLSLKEKENQIKKSIICFKKYLNQHPIGFRAPQHSIDKDTLNLLQKYKFKYDSSFTPLNVLQISFFPKRLKLNLLNFFSNPRKHKLGKLVELPVTSFILPFVSLIFRILPRFILKCYYNLLRALNKNIVLYAHSWDFINMPKSRIARKWPKEILLNNIEYFISYALTKDKFCTLKQIAD